MAGPDATLGWKGMKLPPARVLKICRGLERLGTGLAGVGVVPVGVHAKIEISTVSIPPSKIWGAEKKENKTSRKEKT